MNNSIKWALLLFCTTYIAKGQDLALNQTVTTYTVRKQAEITSRSDNYEKLKGLGYDDTEIFEDLGNANFLSKKYENALYWYGKLMEISEDGVLSNSYQKRYDHAVTKLGKEKQNEIADENWTELVRDDYKMTHVANARAWTTYRRKNFLPWEMVSNQKGTVSKINTDRDDRAEFSPPVALTNGGNTAYFSKPTNRKPVTGIFSKKQTVHKIFKADKIDGEWKKITEVSVCPGDYSAKHPAVSPDGNRLFFASNMPGSFGGYDIYVTNIRENGVLGVAKNLGENVNTLKNDMHPSPLANGRLVFASEGHKGFGGLDLYMVEVGQKKVGLAVNMGNSINGPSHEYAVHLNINNGLGYVVSDRNSQSGNARHVTFNLNESPKVDNEKDVRFMEAFNSNTQMHFSSSVFEDQ